MGKVFPHLCHSPPKERSTVHRAIVAEIQSYKPSMLLLKTDNRCAEITAELFIALLQEKRLTTRNVSPFVVTVPWRGWVVLVPGPAEKEAA